MRILVDITHPAHVHFFRNAISLWRQHGHDIAVTARQKDITIDLLNEYGIPFTTLSSIGNHKLSLFKELVVRDFNLYRFCRKFRPDVLTAIGGVFAAHVGFAVRKPVVVWDDTEHAGISHKLTFPFAASIQTPSCYLKILGDKQVFYAGCHELAYLHPNRFSPDRQVVRSLGVDPDEKYAVIRLVSWQAHHDVGQSGFEKKSITDFIETISKYARPYITSEIKLPDALEKYKLKIPFNKIHHVMAFASLCITEGATMASESAILGVPGVYINTLKLGYIDMHEKYGLVKQTIDTDQALKKCIDFLDDKDIKEKCINARQKFLSEKIDVTQYIVATVENFE